MHVPIDLVVLDDDQECQEGDDVVDGVSQDRERRQLQDAVFEADGGDDAARRDDEQLEDGRAQNGARPDVVVGDEDADDAREQLRGRRADRQEGGARDVRRQVES